MLVKSKRAYLQRLGGNEFALSKGISGHYRLKMTRMMWCWRRPFCIIYAKMPDWEAAFTKIYAVLRPGGSLWITDMVSPMKMHRYIALMWERYGRYLETLGGVEYRKKVFAYVDKEDSPRPVTYQLDLLRKVGFKQVEILHKNSAFAAFGAVK